MTWVTLRDIWKFSQDRISILSIQLANKISYDEIETRLIICFHYYNDFSKEDQNIIDNPTFKKCLYVFKNKPAPIQLKLALVLLNNDKCEKSVAFISTYGYYSIEEEDLTEDFLINDLLNQDLETKDWNPICLYHALKPSLEWQENNIKEYTQLSKNEKKLITDYVSYDYQLTNANLRDNYGNAELNNIIDKFTPLDNDIVVYRVIGKDNFMFMDDIYQNKGYLSTTLTPVGIGNTLMRKNKIIIEIFVPKGTKCVYIPGNEHELLFKHDISMKNEFKEYRYFYSNGKINPNKTKVYYSSIVN